MHLYPYDFYSANSKALIMGSVKVTNSADLAHIECLIVPIALQSLNAKEGMFHDVCNITLPIKSLLEQASANMPLIGFGRVAK